MQESVIDWMNEGIEFERQEQYKKAIECYDKVISLNSKHQSAWYNKGIALSKLNCLEESILCYNRVIDFNCKHEDALYYKGCSLSILGKHEDADNCFNELLKINPFNKDALKYFSTILHNKYNYKEVVNSRYIPTNRLNHEDILMAFSNGRRLFKMLKYKDSIKCFDEILELDLEIDDLWQYKIWRNKAEAYYYLKCNNEGISCFNKAIDYRIKSYHSMRNTISCSFLEHFEFIALYEDIIECYDEIIEMNPHDENAWANKIFALEKSKQYENVIDCCNKAIELNEKSIWLWDTKGIILHNRQCYEESVKCYDKINEIDPHNLDAWNKKGDMLYYNLQKYKEAIICFDKITQLTPCDIQAWDNKAEALFKIQRYKDSLECYDKVLEFDANKVLAWVSKGAIFNELEQDSDALICYDKALALNPSIDGVNWFKGNTLLKLERYDEALESYDDAIRLNPLDENAWNYKGFVLLLLENYEEAIECYDEAMKINPSNKNYCNDKALAFYYLGRYEDAMKYIERNIELQANTDLTWAVKGGLLSESNDFEEVLDCIGKINLKNESWWGMYGATLLELKKYEEAIKYFKKSIEINAKYLDSWISLGSTYFKIGKIEDAINSFVNSKSNILNILMHLDNNERDEISRHIKILLDNDSFFKMMTSNIKDNELDEYKDVYIISLLIMCRLSVSKERFVSHYTKKDISEKLLINSSKFRLNAIDTSNDPTEGFALINFLFNEDQIQTEQQGQDYIAFAGCFTFNHDSLNQFRLYGKEDGKEGTGVSIVLKNSFFYKKHKNLKLLLLDEKYQIYNKQTEDEKHSIFRCIYLDPATGFIHSIGHKEEYLFYRKNDEYKEDFIEDINDYKNSITESLQYIRDKIIILKDRTKELSPSVVSNLLLNLRYLTKHIAFKEEQECRIVEIIRSDNDKIRTDEISNKKYIDYLSIRNHVKKIYFGPKATCRNLYQTKIKDNGLSILCENSEQPFA